jgi:hypothetical protein
LEELGQVRVALAECDDVPLWSSTDAQIGEELVQAWASAQQALAVVAHLIREAESRGLPKKEAASSTPVWLRQRIRTSMWEGRRLAKLSATLHDFPALDTAVSRGDVSAEQATVIADAITDLPPDTGTEPRQRAESLLITYAGEFDPLPLAKIGARILAHVDPDAADRHDAEALRRQDERAHRARGFTLSPRGDGLVRLSGWLGTTAAAAVNAALDPLCHPGRDPKIDGETPRTPAQRRADALVDVCNRALRGGDLPATGGDAAQVVVTIPVDVLRTEPDVAEGSGGVLDTGAPISVAEARQLACDAQIIPAVLGTDGQVLDLGRAKRLINGPIRRALILRDGGCAFPSCDRPANWADGHHIKAWADGGATALSNACLLCRYHHQVIHHTEWQVRIGADGNPEFLPPPSIDPLRMPVRNVFHRRQLLRL